MNKTFKRAVSSVLASAMAFSSVTVATVSTTLPFTAAQAFAAETTTVASWKSGDATIPAAFGAEAALSSIGNSQMTLILAYLLLQQTILVLLRVQSTAYLSLLQLVT